MLKWKFEECILGMKVGESFFIPTLTPSHTMGQIKRFADKAGVSITCKQAMQEDVLGVRTWRILEPAVDLHPDE